MMDYLKKVANDWFTGIDGKTHDPARASFVISVASYIVMAGYNLFAHSAWSGQDFGVGLAAIVAGHGFAIKIKSNTEPPAAVSAEPESPATTQ